jgi:hypothetical protein
MTKLTNKTNNQLQRQQTKSVGPKQTHPYSRTTTDQPTDNRIIGPSRQSTETTNINHQTNDQTTGETVNRQQYTGKREQATKRIRQHWQKNLHSSDDRRKKGEKTDEITAIEPPNWLNSLSSIYQMYIIDN